MIVDALVLTSARAEELVRFYRALGVPLEDERHDDGPLHWACELGAVHFAIYAGDDAARAPAGAARAPGRRMSGSTLVGLRVPDVDAATAAAVAAGARVLVAVEDVPWGRRSVVEDPDGRPVELNQAPAG